MSRLLACIHVDEDLDLVLQLLHLANHLTYPGDAVIAAGVNVGAGTITCNHDGVGKSTTTIEDGAFIGSNSSLVAPVTIGKDATIAAGQEKAAGPSGGVARRPGQTVHCEGSGRRSAPRARDTSADVAAGQVIGHYELTRLPFGERDQGT